MTLEEYEAKWAADEAELLRLAEWRRIERRLEECYRAVAAGTATILIRERMARLEALQAAMLGNPEALAA